VHGVCAVEHKWGSGGWVRSVVLDREVVLDSATGFAGYGCGTAEGYFANGFRERYASGRYTAVETRASGYAASSSEPYGLVGRAANGTSFLRALRMA
jgi:hypothetical protein